MMQRKPAAPVYAPAPSVFDLMSFAGGLVVRRLAVIASCGRIGVNEAGRIPNV